MEEKFIVFTSIYQLKKFKNINQIFIDGTFKYCPKHFYQIFNIIGNEIETNNKIPLMYILMSNKSYQLYYCIFEYIQKILILENI